MKLSVRLETGAAREVQPELPNGVRRRPRGHGSSAQVS